MSDKEKIISLLDELASIEKMGSFFMNNATPDFLFIYIRQTVNNLFSFNHCKYLSPNKLIV